jgi:hypothetical protein
MDLIYYTKVKNLKIDEVFIYLLYYPIVVLLRALKKWFRPAALSGA